MKSLLTHGRNILRSIASLPSVIFLLFVILGFVQLASGVTPGDLPGWVRRFNISDLDTIRTTLAAVITGVFTLTIFAYTMVMNVIDRSISSYSPRLLPLILAERYHQAVLGVGAGTIAHSTILLLGVAEPPDAAQPPPLAAASAGFFAVLSLVLFIYFIHRVSRSIHVNALLYKSFQHTRSRIQALASRSSALEWHDHPARSTEHVIRATRCGYLDELDTKALVGYTEIEEVLARPGNFVYAGQPVLRLKRAGTPDDPEYATLFDLTENEPVDVYATGFRHLVEVAIKAASPALNDPATSLTAMHYLVQLFADLAAIGRYNTIVGNSSKHVVIVNVWTPAELITDSYRELRRYLDTDPWGRRAIEEGLQRIARVYADGGDAEAVAAARREASLLPPA